jgi:diguanylate cyclase (GGDEF)-like protein
LKPIQFKQLTTVLASKDNRSMLLNLVFILVFAFGVQWLFKTLNLDTLVENLELSTYDLRFMSPPRSDHKPSKAILIVTFDDDTLSRYESRFGAWPWSRNVHSDLITYLNRANVKTIVFDIMFSGKRTASEDQRLADTFKRHKNVYFSLNLDNKWPLKQIGPMQPNSPLQQVLPYTILLEPYTTAQRMGHLKPSMNNLFGNTDLAFVNYRSLIPALMQVGERKGMINHIRDADGVSRGNPLFYQLLYEDNGVKKAVFLPYIGLKILMDRLKLLPNTPMVLQPNGHLTFPGYDIPLTPQGTMLANWYEHNSNQYIQIPAWLLLDSMYRIQSGKAVQTDTQLMRMFRDKTVFVGSTAVSTYDLKTTSINPRMPGVIMQAVMFDNLIQNTQYIWRVSDSVNALIAGALCVLASILLVKIRNSFIAFLAPIAVIGLYATVACYVFRQYGMWLNMAAPLAYVSFTSLMTFSVKYLSRDMDYRKSYHFATTDVLTELYNHRFFQDTMLTLLESNEKSGGNFSLILIDIDHFKQFNDKYGHLVGDMVLKLVAQKLKISVRAHDTVARYGGEEMAILLSRTPYQEAVTIAQKLVETIGAMPFEPAQGTQHRITISAGVATYPQHGGKGSELIARADQCLYYAKAHGRNQVGLPPPQQVPANLSAHTAKQNG